VAGGRHAHQRHDGRPERPDHRERPRARRARLRRPGALRALVRGATRPCRAANGAYTEREALAEYLRLGYVPHDLNTDATAHAISAFDRPWGTAATTLEYDAADAAIAALAARWPDADRERLPRAGRDLAAARRAAAADGPAALRRRALPRRGRSGDGGGLRRGQRGPVRLDGAPRPCGLAASMGGRGAALARLDRFFTRLNAGRTSRTRSSATSRTSARRGSTTGSARRGRRSASAAGAARALRPTPGGMPGNDDGGTMSAWWVLGALGLYPAVPGSDVLRWGARCSSGRPCCSAATA
jgi:hypothetical protein